MLTADELREIQGLLRYLNDSETMKLLKPNDIELICDDGSVAAVVGIDGGCGEYVLKKVGE